MHKWVSYARYLLSGFLLLRNLFKLSEVSSSGRRDVGPVKVPAKELEVTRFPTPASGLPCQMFL